MLAVIETLPVHTGSAENEAERHLMLQEFAAAVPEELILPKAIIESPPINVTTIPGDCDLLSSLELKSPKIVMLRLLLLPLLLRS